MFAKYNLGVRLFSGGTNAEKETQKGIMAKTPQRRGLSRREKRFAHRMKVMHTLYVMKLVEKGYYATPAHCAK
jgi:hypothetical protein